jgi:putative oxidoreductase
MAESRTSATDIGLLALRLGLAALLIGFHGWTRLVRAFHFVILDEPWTFVTLVERIGFPLAPVFAVLSALAESVGALFVGLGLFTRFAAFAILINMGVAVVFEAFNGDPIELPGLYLLIAVVLVLMGGGRLTIGRLRG